jgi:hypothetical protein
MTTSHRRSPRRVLAAGAMIGAVTVAVVGFGGAAHSVVPPGPTMPGTITVSLVTYNSASLTWGKSSDPLGIEGYQIYRQASGGIKTLIATADGGITHYNASSLYSATSYTFGVVAIDSAGQTSPEQDAAPFSTAAHPTGTLPPVAPSNSSVSVKPFSDTRIDVVWGGSATPDVSGYQVFRDGSPVGRIDLPGGLRFSDNGLAPTSIHSYTIEAIDSSNTASAATSAKSATTLATGTVQIARGPYLSNVTATSAIVSWWTNIASLGVVGYGLTSAAEHSQNDAVGSLQHHAVTLTGLTGETTYQYTVGNGSVTSAVASFRTTAAPGTTFSFAAIGDFGGGSPGETQNAANIASAGTSFIQTLGDNIYPSAGNPEPGFSQYLSDYDARFFKPFAAAIKGQSFMPANGNQEYYSNGAFWSTFPMFGSNHSWYSYNWGDAHITVLDSELAVDPLSPQFAFLQADLAANQNANFRIVVTQRPPHSSVSATSSSSPADAYLVPLFEQYGVALVLSGNSHNYERSFPLTGGVPAARGVTYVVSGGGGNGHNTFTVVPAPAWSAFRDASRYEYVKVTVSPTRLQVDAIDAATNTVFDTTTIAAPPVPGTYVAQPPQRLLDTRNGTGAPKAPVAPGQVLALPVTGGTTGVPAGASAVVLNTTVVGPTGGGYLTVYPDGVSRPLASNLDFVRGQVVANLVTVKVGGHGKVAFFNGSSGSTQLVADLAGYYRGGTASAPGAFVPMTPTRLLDTRNGTGAPRSAVANSSFVPFTAAGGSTGVPTGVSAVVLNVTAVGPTASGYITAYADGTTRATVSNLDFVRGQTVPNLVTVKVGSNGKVDLFNGSGGTVNLVADIAGYYIGGVPTDPGAFNPVAPQRLLDTRFSGAVPSNGTVSLPVNGGSTHIPTGISAVILNVTAVSPIASGYVTVYPTGVRPLASNLDFARGQTVPNLVIVKVGPDGKVVLFNGSGGSTQLLADVAGYFS